MMPRPQLALRRIRSSWQEALVCLALVVWTFGQVAFDLSRAFEAVSILSKLGLGHVYKPLTICILVTVILVRGLHMRPLGYAGIAAAVGVLGVSYLCSDNAWQLVLFLFLLAVRGIRLEVLFRLYLGTVLAALVTVLALSMLPSVTVRYDSPNGFLVSAYGFGHPNTYGCLLFAITTAMALTFDLRRTWLPLAVLCVACGLCSFFLCSCRSAAVLETGLAIFVVAYGLWHDPIDSLCSRRVTRIVVAAFPIVLACVLLLLFVLFLQGNEFAMAVDRMLGARMQQARGVFEQEGGFTLFGRALKGVSMFETYTSTKAFVGVDSTYYRYSLVEGIASMVCWAIVYVRAMLKRESGRSKTVFMALAALYSLYFITETSPTFLALNCSLLFLSEGVHPGEVDCAATQDEPVERGGAKRLALPVTAAVVLTVALGWTFALSRSNGTGQRNASGDFPAQIHAVLEGAPNEDTDEVTCEMAPDGLMTVTFAGQRLQGIPRKIYTKDRIAYYSFRHEDKASDMAYSVVLGRPMAATPSNPSGVWSMRVSSSKKMSAGFRLSLEPDGRLSLVSGPYDIIAMHSKQLGDLSVSGAWTSKSEGERTTIEGDVPQGHLAVSVRQ